MENIEVLFKHDGIIEPLNGYILVKPTKSGVDIHTEATLYELCLGVVAVYDALIKEATKYSDQDLYQVCEAAGVDFTTMRTLIQEARKNE